MNDIYSYPGIVIVLCVAMHITELEMIEFVAYLDSLE